MSLNSSRTLFHSELVTLNALKLKKEGLVDILLCTINTTKQTRNVIGGSLVPLEHCKCINMLNTSKLYQLPDYTLVCSFDSLAKHKIYWAGKSPNSVSIFLLIDLQDYFENFAVEGIKI